MDSQDQRIIAIIDPSQTEQWALRKAVSLMNNRGEGAILAYLCVDWRIRCDDLSRLRSVELKRCRLWLDHLIEEYADHAVNIEPIVEWGARWQERVCEIAAETEASMVIKRASGRPRSLTNSDRELIRNLKDCPLLLVKHDPTSAPRKVLVAVDFNARDESHTSLNAAIMEMGQRIRSASEDIELHSISAYPSSDRFVHPPDVARVLGISRSQAHVRHGAASDVIPQTANSIGADLVIVGNVGRRGLSGITVGNTAEKILADIDADVLVLVKEMQRAREAA